MIKKLLPASALLSLFLISACSTGKVAVQNQNDDVYYSVAQAQEVPEQTETAPVQSDEVATDSDNYREDYLEEDYRDYDYATRINRFHRYSPWRSYYDYYDFYDPFDPFNNRFGYSPYYNRFYTGLRINLYFGRPWYDPFFYGYGARFPYYGYGYGYGYPYGYNRWGGIYSYYNTFPGYYSGVGRTYYASPNYRPRPSRDFDNTYGSPERGGGSGRGSVRPDGRVLDTRTRADRYGEGRSSGSYPSTIRSSRPETTSGARPSRTDVSRPAKSSGTTTRSGQNSSGSSARPTRTEQYTPPPAPASTSERSSSGSSSSSSPSRSSSESSSGRPSRGGN